MGALRLSLIQIFLDLFDNDHGSHQWDEPSWSEFGYTNLLMIDQRGLASGASVDVRLSPNGVSGRDLLAPAWPLVSPVTWVDLSVLMSGKGRVSRVSPVQTALRNCTRDEVGPFGFCDQELIPSYRKLLWSKAMVVCVADKSGR